MHLHTLSDFDFALPTELIAQRPAARRSDSRLLDARTGQTDTVFNALPALLQPGDLLVFNDTRVVNARLFGAKTSGGRLELLVERVIDSLEVAAHLRVSKKPAVGAVLLMDGGFTATVLGRWPNTDGPLYRFAFSHDPFAVMAAHGHVPLPPYITHADDSEDAQRYQTIFAKNPGAVAAPTAALHFDDELIAALDARGVQRATVTLHVGAGTFQPVKTENLAEHHMHHERYAIGDDVVRWIELNLARPADSRGRLVAVGTTTVRALESWARSGHLEGDTDIFITPGFEFQLVDLLITNFHLPKSTLMMMVSAFSGYAHIMRVYAHAIAQRYRFFSYGDAMLLERSPTKPPTT